MATRRPPGSARRGRDAVGVGLVYTGSVSGFIAARFVLGLGESGNFPASIKAVAEWFPKKERALATGIFNSGTNVGALVVPLACRGSRHLRLVLGLRGHRRHRVLLAVPLVAIVQEPRTPSEGEPRRTGLHPQRPPGPGGQGAVEPGSSSPPGVGVHRREVHDGPHLVAVLVLDS